MAPNWAEIVTAIGTVGGATGIVFVWRTVKETERSRHAQMAAEFSRRWGEPSLVECRQLMRRYETRGELRDALRKFLDANAHEYYVLLRELDFFEDLAIAEKQGAVPLAYIEDALGPLVVQRRDIWLPTLQWFREADGADVYENFQALASRLERKFPNL